MSGCGLLIGAGAGIVAGGYLGYKILKKKNPKLLGKIAADVKYGFSEGFTRAYSSSEKTTTSKPSRFKGLTKAFCEGFDSAYCRPQGRQPALALA
jgi:hypothetical protein